MKIDVRKVNSKTTDDWLLKKHYAKRICSRSFCFGLFVDAKIEGVVTYGVPASPQVGRSLVGDKFKNQVFELNRLCINSTAPKNSASMLVGRSLKLLPENIAVVSYADEAMGHKGYVYQATNFIYCGKVRSHDCEYLINGNWGHARSLCSLGITSTRLWALQNKVETRPPSEKHRYVIFPGKKNKLKKFLLWEPQKYPKGESLRYQCEDIKMQMQHILPIQA